MRILIFAIFICLTYNLYSTEVSNYDFVSSDEGFEISLKFNKSFDGQIRKQITKDKTILTFSNLSIKENCLQDINSALIKNISITNAANTSLAIELSSPYKLDINATKNANNTAMKVKISTKDNFSFYNIGAQKENNISTKYISVIIVLGILCLILLFIKRKILVKKEQLNNNLSSPIKNEFENLILHFGAQATNKFDVLFEKYLDEKNKVMLIQYEECKYLVLVGSSNVLLDHFGEDKIRTKNDFESFFEENKQKLNAYLTKRQNSLENYKNTLLEN